MGERLRDRVLPYYLAGTLPGRRPGRCFVVYGLGRTGSELLVSLLDSHPEVRCEGEILEQPVRDGTRYLRGRARLAARRGVTAYGMKLLVHQSRDRHGDNGVLHGVRAAGWQVVHLRRRNLLRHALSFIDVERGQPHVAVGATNRFESITVEPEYLLAGIVGLEAAAKVIAGHLEPGPDLELVYEDDLGTEARQAETSAMLFEWLGLPASSASTRFVRRTPKRLEDAIANYDEVAKLIRQTRYASMLDED